jgi:hypothetical protein
MQPFRLPVPTRAMQGNAYAAAYGIPKGEPDHDRVGEGCDAVIGQTGLAMVSRKGPVPGIVYGFKESC